MQQHAFPPERKVSCSACGRKNHWAKVCNNRQENKGRWPQTHITQKGPKSKPGHQETHGNQQYRHQDKKHGNHVYSLDACQCERDDMYEQFAQTSFDAIKRQSKGLRFLQTLISNLPNLQGTHKLKAKVDTGAEGNTLPLCVFRKMSPHKVSTSGHTLSSATRKESTVLTAYNGSSIPQHGSIHTYKGEWKTLKFFIVTLEAPTILGLPSLRDLELVMMHCIIQEN